VSLRLRGALVLAARRSGLDSCVAFGRAAT
jgi:hypothetical protein